MRMNDRKFRFATSKIQKIGYFKKSPTNTCIYREKVVSLHANSKFAQTWRLNAT